MLQNVVLSSCRRKTPESSSVAFTWFKQNTFFVRYDLSSRMIIEGFYMTSQRSYCIGGLLVTSQRPY